MKYTIDFDSEQQENSSCINIPVVETIESNDSYGDQIGIDRQDNTLWFDEYLDIDSEDIQEFIKFNFKDYKAVSGFIRRHVER